MTKIVTATAVMQLAQQGILDLDAPVNTYLPAFKKVVQPRPVTVRHLHLGDGSVAGPRPGETVRLLSAQSAAQMRTTTARGGKLDFGLGWYKPHTQVGEPAYVEHLGGGSGFFCAMRLYPGTGGGLVLMSNTTSFRYKALLAEIADRSLVTSYP